MKRGFTLIEILVVLVSIGLLSVAVLSALPSIFQANRSSTYDQQVILAAKTYLEDLRDHWKTAVVARNTGQPLALTIASLNSLLTPSSGPANIIASLTVTGRDLDGDTPVVLATCPQAAQQECIVSSEKRRWRFDLVVSSGSRSQTYLLELGW
jgi:prepilin-type N-terminal cleavage/methylation domain-containing protein